MADAMVKVLRLPVDLVLLTCDFLTLTHWRVLKSLAVAFGVMGPHSGPFCGQRYRCVDQSGRGCRTCGHARRYGNKRVFSILCRWVMVAHLDGPGDISVCTRRTRFKPSVPHYTVTAVLLGLFWTSLGRLMLRVVL